MEKPVGRGTEGRGYEDNGGFTGERKGVMHGNHGIICLATRAFAVFLLFGMY